MAINSKHYDERVGATGVILIDYPKEFEQSLLAMIDDDKVLLDNKKNRKRMSKYVYGFINESHYMEFLDNIWSACKQLKWSLHFI